MKSKKVFYIITTVLVCILLELSVVTYKRYVSKTNQRVPSVNSEKNTSQDLKLISKEEVIKKLSAVNSMNCLGGEDEVQQKFANDSITDEDTKFAWLKKKLNGRELFVDATFKYTFAYELSNISDDIEVKNNIVTIIINPNNLSLLQCELDESKTTLSSSTGLFADKFEPQELNDINGRVKDSARNTIQSDPKRRSKAIKNLENNIEALLKTISSENIKFNFIVPDYDVIPQDDVKIIEHDN
jgi:hypothetical protein